MEALATMQSGQSSIHSLKKTITETYGINIDSDPTLTSDFNNISNAFSLLPSLLVHDSPESSHRKNPTPGSLINSGKNEIIHIAHTKTRINNDGVWNKYGSKVIRYSPYKRFYYKCRYKYCKAKKQVQQIKKDQDSPLLFKTTYLNRHNCKSKVPHHNTHGSTTMIQFDNQVSSGTDCDIPPLLSDDHQEPIIHPLPLPLSAGNDVHVSWLNSTDDHQEPIIHAPVSLPLPLPLPVVVPARDDDHVACLNSTDTVSDMKAEDESSLNPTIPVDDMNDDDEDLLNFYEPVLSPSLDINTLLGDDFNLNF